MNFDKGYKSFQEDVTRKFSDLKWSKPKTVNNCDLKQNKFTLNNTQKFVSRYFTPQNPNGLLMWHSVGSGKTLSAISILNNFEKYGYNTLWVTRSTLKGDLSKALEMLPLRKPLFTLSYKQFSNIYKGTGENFKKLMTRARKLNSATSDPLYKTIVVVDEAHKLFTKDLKPQEMHDIKAIQQMIYESYARSGRNSVKLVVMTGTPITENYNEILYLLNLLIQDPRDRINVATFDRDYLDASGKFTKQGAAEFKERIKDLVSYIDMSKDPSKFAQIRYKEVLVPMSAHSVSAKDASMQPKFCTEEYKMCRDDLKISARECKATKAICSNRIKLTRNTLKKIKDQRTVFEDKCKLNI
jgi:type I site-specific restriction-modification system R (restriction) subunit